MTEITVIAESLDAVSDALDPALERNGIAIETHAGSPPGAVYRVRLPLSEDAQLLYASGDMEVLDESSS